MARCLRNGVSVPGSCAVDDIVWVGEGRMQPAAITSILGSTITVDWLDGSLTNQNVDACSVTKNGRHCGNSCTTAHVPL